MLRKFVGAAFVLLVGVGLLFGDEIKGKVKKIEKGKEKGDPTTITITDKDNKDHSLKYKGFKDAKLIIGDKVVDATDKDAMKGFREKFKEGAEVTIIYEKKDDKTTIKEIKVK